MTQVSVQKKDANLGHQAWGTLMGLVQGVISQTTPLLLFPPPLAVP